MLIVLLAPPLFRRMGMPGLVGLIVSGAVVGPNALGLLQCGSTFELLGTVGLLSLMFTAGLSIDLNQFVGYKGQSLTFGGLSFRVPAALAYGASWRGHARAGTRPSLCAAAGGGRGLPFAAGIPRRRTARDHKEPGRRRDDGGHDGD
jgi:Kef-type K+ transport system membrane component KefB